jgi:aquaporin Z
MKYAPYLAEYVGSFFFIFMILLSDGNPLIIAGALALTIFLVGGISGAHINPAVSLAQYLHGSLGPADLLSFIVVQLVGGASAVYAYRFTK